ncbi:hypothetical protein [Sorangium sp. So ce1389]|uniref:hypothetical protein n=1 Tax=Sorangium sp. So ce1389 TaxID=3133336 RepID=UPI003F616268
MKINTLVCLCFIVSSFGMLACVAPADDSALAGESTEELSEALMSRGGGSGGLGFECNTPGFPGKCSCEGPIDSQDCLDMAINCSGEIKCGLFVDNCVCDMWLSPSPASTKPAAPYGPGDTPPVLAP